MRPELKDFFDKVSSSIKFITSKLAILLGPIINPIKLFFKPATDKYIEFTSPIRNWHASISESQPLMGKAITWTYRIVKYGFYFLLAMIMLSLIGVFGHMPSKAELRKIENSNTTEIYSADSVLIGRFYIENRTEIGLEYISPYVVTALLAVEDKRFFEHSGIDLRSLFRVFKGVATSQSNLGGGSTLSQQLAKNLYPRKDYFIPGISILINKIKENIISIRLESIYNKEELLALYLNTVPFGGDRFGINVASRYFFKKKAKDLDPGESATLIGMLKATTKLDPTRNPNNSQKRRNLVLERMVKNSNFTFNDDELKTVSSLVANGKITQKDFDAIKDKPINAKRNIGDDTNDGKGAYFKEYLRINVMPKILGKLTKADGSKYNLYRDGLKIYTSLDNRLQTFAENSMIKHMSDLQAKFNKHWKSYKGEEKPWGDDKWLEEQKVKSERYQLLKQNNVSKEEIEKQFNTPTKMTVFSWKEGGSDTDTIMTPLDSVKHYFLMLNTGFMAMDHSNGHIKAWIGGTNFKYFKYDHIQSRRQVGSTFKPIVYAAAVKDSVKPCQYFKNQQVTIIDWTPKNSDDKYGGWVSMYGGLANSVNVIAAKLIEKVGIQKTIDLATAMGITSVLPREFGISLGAADIQLFEMMKVYGTLANKGVRPEPVSVLMVKDRDGNIIYDYNEELKKNPKLGPHVQALSEDEAAVMTRMMQAVIDQGTGRKFRDRYGNVGEYAGKTGTTQNHSDGWFMVYNPYLTAGAWVGGPSRAVRFRIWT
jgi:penicillin-binding protein 1A